MHVLAYYLHVCNIIQYIAVMNSLPIKHVGTRIKFESNCLALEGAALSLPILQKILICGVGCISIGKMFYTDG